MDYKERMLFELLELQDKISLLNNYLASTVDQTKNEDELLKEELMQKQFEVMWEYRSLLLERLKLEFK